MNRLFILTALSFVFFGLSSTEAAITAVNEIGLGGDAPAIISQDFGEEALAFSDRTHQHNGAAFDAGGMLVTPTGPTIIPLPGYLEGRDYVRFANNARDQPDYVAEACADTPSTWYLLIDNRLDGPAGNASSPNTTDAVLGGTLQWVIDGGWQRVNTGISPGGQADYTAVDEGGDAVGPGMGLNQFYSVWTLPEAATCATVGNNGVGGSNMISLVSAQPGIRNIDFETDPGLELFGVAEIRSEGGNPEGYLSITDAANGQRGTVLFPDLTGNGVGRFVIAARTGGANSAHHIDNLSLHERQDGFSLGADLRIGGGTDLPADGISFNYARPNDPIFANGRAFSGGVEEEGTTTGVSLAFDEWNTGVDGCGTTTDDCIGLSVRIDGRLAAQLPFPTLNGAVDDITSLQTGPAGVAPSELGWARLQVDVTNAPRGNLASPSVKIEYKGAEVFNAMIDTLPLQWIGADGNGGSGIFQNNAHWLGGTHPTAGDVAEFNSNADPVVTFTSDAQSDELRISDGNVTFVSESESLRTYSLANLEISNSSLQVGMAGMPVFLDVGNDLLIGTELFFDPILDTPQPNIAAVSIAEGGSVRVGNRLRTGSNGTLHVNGGTLTLDGPTNAALFGLRYTRGVINIGDPASHVAFTEHGIRIGDNSFIESPVSLTPSDAVKTAGDSYVEARAELNLSGGRVTARSLRLDPGSTLIATTDTSALLGPFVGLVGSKIDVAGGNLSIGSSSDANGFYSNGTVSVAGGSTLIVLDANDAAFDTGSFVRLGNDAAGILNAANGLTLDFGGNVTGYGTIETPNEPGKPLTNNGHITGTSLTEPITLPGYIKGVGTCDNCVITGTDAPGFSTAAVNRGSVRYDGTLEIEVGGTSPGSGYDQLNHILGEGIADLNGTLNVELTDGFSPGLADTFDIITTIGGVTGAFANTQLPNLGLLAFDLRYGDNSVTLAVVPGLAGDFDVSGQLDAGDIDLLFAEVRAETNVFIFDLDQDGKVDALDRDVWVAELKRTYYGDANLDGEFNSGDLVGVFQAGEYEDDLAMNSSWATGDWNGDADVDSGDLVLAFQDGGFEKGPRGEVNAVPEPTSVLLILVGLFGIAARRRSVT